MIGLRETELRQTVAVPTRQEGGDRGKPQRSVGAHHRLSRATEESAMGEVRDLLDRMLRERDRRRAYDPPRLDEDSAPRPQDSLRAAIASGVLEGIPLSAFATSSLSARQ